MSAHDWFGCERVEAPRAERSRCSAVHPESHVASIEALCARGRRRDRRRHVSRCEGTYEAALRGAGGAARAGRRAARRRARAPACRALRPPGHHAEAARAMGFCFFDNVAVAARRARDAHGAERVLILDWDVHHGNGTNDIFHADPGVLFVSIHESPLYPGHGPGVRRRARARGRATRSTCRCPAARATPATARWSSTSRAR